MNYRAWNHRCWLISYMTNKQLRFQRVVQGWPTLFSFQKISLTSLYRSKATSSGENCGSINGLKFLWFGKCRLEGWMLKHEKIMVQMTGRYAKGKG
ncbi:unnamed protein product [Trifolium pratense]|uniref:Uncharacterized protein n=1 Tax=Trifolium pratense TaxID=57577 RepID=A0ACB0JKW8_TRIPR|nr:unnamed protein product [Trifolium pratense]